MTSRKPTDAELARRFKAWKRQQPSATGSAAALARLDRDLCRRVTARLSALKRLSAREYELYHKRFQMREVLPTLSPKHLAWAKRLVWTPRSKGDFRRIEPELLYVKPQVLIRSVGILGDVRNDSLDVLDDLNTHWTILRHIVSSATHDGFVGRALRFLVRDRNSQKYLGILCISGDMLDLKPRNDHIGWTRQQYTVEHRINHLANVQTCVPTQPFGTLYNGGKLLALLALSDVVARTWQDEYGDRLVGLTTTSLWGNERDKSMYDGLKPRWLNTRELSGSTDGKTSGSTLLLPDPDLYGEMREWMRVRYPRQFWEHFVATGSDGMMLKRDNKNRALAFCYSRLGVPRDLITSGHQRGVYYAPLYQQANEFLRGEIDASALRQKFPNQLSELVNVWRADLISGQPGIAKARLNQLAAQKQWVASKPRYYDALASLSWHQARQMFGSTSQKKTLPVVITTDA